MKQLLEMVEQNPELKAKIEELDKNPDTTMQDIIQLTAEYGIELTEEDFKPAGRQGELSDEELDAVAGGDDCVCVLGGGGTSKAMYDRSCACVLGGGGENVAGNTRCVCVLGGLGDSVYVYPCLRK